MTEPAEAADPTENAEATDPIDPTEATEPTEPIERVDPFEAIERNESSDQSDTENCGSELTAPGRPRRWERRGGAASAPSRPPLR